MIDRGYLFEHPMNYYPSKPTKEGGKSEKPAWDIVYEGQQGQPSLSYCLVGVNLFIFFPINK